MARTFMRTDMINDTLNHGGSVMVGDPTAKVNDIQSSQVGGEGEGALEAVDEQTPGFCSALGKIWWILPAPVFFVAVGVQGFDALSLWYYKSTVSCNMLRDVNGTIITFEAKSDDWSGSDHCNDKCYTAEQGTWIFGIVKGCEALAQVCMYPLLGAAADWYGRSSVISVGAVGVTVGYGLWTLSAALAKSDAAGNENAIFFVLVLASMTKGGTGAYEFLVPVQIIDVIKRRDLGPALSVGIAAEKLCAFCALLFVVVIVSSNLTNYIPVHGAITVMCFITTVLACCFHPETLPEDGRVPISFSNSLPFVGTQILWSKPRRKLFTASVFLGICALFGIITILPAFVTTVYGWPQAVFPLLALGIAFSTVVGVTLTNYAWSTFEGLFGKEDTESYVFSSAQASMALATVFMTAAHETYVCFIIAYVIFCLAVGPWFCSFKIISARMEPPEHQGNLQAAVMSVVLIGNSISPPFFGMLVKAVGIGGDDCGDNSNKILYPGFCPLLICFLWVSAAIFAWIWVYTKYTHSQNEMADNITAAALQVEQPKVANAAPPAYNAQIASVTSTEPSEGLSMLDRSTHTNPAHTEPPKGTLDSDPRTCCSHIC